MNNQPKDNGSIGILILKILDSLESNETVRSMTKNLVRMAKQYGLLKSNNPLGEAAGLIYIAGILSDNPVTLAVIAENAGISPETVRKFKTRFASELKTMPEWPGLPPNEG